MVRASGGGASRLLGYRLPGEENEAQIAFRCPASRTLAPPGAATARAPSRPDDVARAGGAVRSGGGVAPGRPAGGGGTPLSPGADGAAPALRQHAPPRGH